MSYQDTADQVFAHCTVPDGYFGDTRRMGVAMIGNRVVLVDDHGYHGAGVPMATDEREALYLLRHHPDARHIANVVEVQP